jgi:hypothetical protein
MWKTYEGRQTVEFGSYGLGLHGETQVVNSG